MDTVSRLSVEAFFDPAGSTFSDTKRTASAT